MCINGGNFQEFEQAAQTKPGAAQAEFAVRTYAANEHVFFEGDCRTHLFVVESGWVKLYRTLIDGQRQVVGFCNGGSLLGLEGGEDHVNGCEAITAVKLRVVPLSRVGEVCSRHPELGNYLLQQVGRQLGAAQAQLTTVGVQSAEQKLATLLLSASDYDSDEADAFDLPMRRGDMAEFLGIRLETVSRQMSHFQKRKWIRMASMYRCQILNRDALESLAEGGQA
jgi:CRP/FNR family transcriptional regulator, anaerobic regulatory protein